MVRKKMCKIHDKFDRWHEEIDIWAKNGRLKMKKSSSIIEYKANQLEVQYQFNHVM